MQESHRAESRTEIASALLAWYGREARALPWRAARGTRQDPYKVWLSEIMLQQTTVKTVGPRYLDFLRRWPDVASLARAELGEVLAAWAGLGYYARARNLHACARAVVQDHDGQFPETEAGLRALPGIGAYTSAAIAAIAFGADASPVDGNIERVIARLFALKTPLPALKAEIKTYAQELVPKGRAGDFAQGLMDLGATICTPKRPACALCPLRPFCQGFAEGIAASLPQKAAKAARPIRRGTAFVALREDGAVLLRERPPKGLLGGMLETPSTLWAERANASGDVGPGEGTSPGGGTSPGEEAMIAAPLAAPFARVPGIVTHTFTHFHLELCVYRANVARSAEVHEAADPGRCRWVPRRDLPEAALPSVMRKVLAHALEESPPRAKKRLRK